ncbi:MAG: tRNA1(Val) (adenine(37)-N6)-methyltransferase [Rhodospirillales bacterium]
MSADRADAYRPAGTPAVAEDALLGGRVRLVQPAEGYRAAIDPVFLAAAVPAAAGESVLDVGAGTGAAALCLAARVADVRVRGVEIAPDLVRLALGNAGLNGLAGRVQFIAGDLLRPPAQLAARTFDHVMANPPYLPAGRGHPPPDAAKRAARVEGAAGIEDWLRFCVAMVRPKGSVTLIHRADRLDAVLAALRERAGGIVVFPLWPGPARGADAAPAKRVIVRARKGVAAPLRLAPGLVLHEAGGAFTPEAEAVLRDARGLRL